jgi:hypothetical protein
VLVAQKYETRREVFDYHQKLYRTKDSPLNYNERVKFLRELQADSIRAVYERLESARIGLAIAGIAKLRKIPAWTSQPSGVLGELVKWMREALRSLEVSEVSEFPMTLVISSLAETDEGLFKVNGRALSEYWFAGPQDLLKEGDDNFTFEFSEKFLHDSYNWKNNNKPIRLASEVAPEI